jgi:hypothetical protein
MPIGHPIEHIRGQKHLSITVNRPELACHKPILAGQTPEIRRKEICNSPIGTRNLRDKKSLPENLVNYRAFLALRATYGRGSAHVFLGDGGAEGEPVDDGIGFPQRGQLEPGRSLVA